MDSASGYGHSGRGFRLSTSVAAPQNQAASLESQTIRPIQQLLGQTLRLLRNQARRTCGITIVISSSVTTEEFARCAGPNVVEMRRRPRRVRARRECGRYAD